MGWFYRSQVSFSIPSTSGAWGQVCLWNRELGSDMSHPEVIVWAWVEESRVVEVESQGG